MIKNSNITTNLPLYSLILCRKKYSALSFYSLDLIFESFSSEERIVVSLFFSNNFFLILSF